MKKKCVCGAKIYEACSAFDRKGCGGSGNRWAYEAIGKENLYLQNERDRLEKILISLIDVSFYQGRAVSRKKIIAKIKQGLEEE